MGSAAAALFNAIRVNVAGMAKPERAKPSAIMDKTKSLRRMINRGVLSSLMLGTDNCLSKLARVRLICRSLKVATAVFINSFRMRSSYLFWCTSLSKASSSSRQIGRAHV